MAITNYTELQAAAANWQARSDLTATIPDAITLAEAKLNRDLGEVLATSTLTGIINNRAIDITALSVAEPITLYLTFATGIGETEMLKRADGDFPYGAVADVPSIWAMAGANIVFDCPLLSAYSFRFHYRQRFALSVASPTNWLLTNHPDIYLAATLIWGGLFTSDDKRMATFAAVLSEGVSSLKAYISRQNRSTMTADPALLLIANRRRSTFNILTGS